ncbi:MAG: phosphoribosylglycinamide formyltransferase [Omnitrophica WOR_2 bacterium GWA2_47_8]|nr:MAG: phosphoribosylglycinamide formyltransferase [Omnitrophica WOR_2 bacterium GWA2_47_8]
MRFAVLASGNGTNLQAIIDAVKKGEIAAELALVVSNSDKAYALKRAESAGIKTLFLSPKEFTNPQSYDRQLSITLKEEKIDLIVLAGYMRLLTPYFVKAFPQKIINVHPSLLPSFKGLQGIKDAFTYGTKVTGATVHFVDEMMDHGPIILQEPVRVSEKDTLETLGTKIHEAEHKILPKAIQLFAEGRLKVKRRTVVILEKEHTNTSH